ncbi:fatty acid-binding protein-like [Ostrinia nubilalis]|uniref:fatty acid-binding protein-like n=1 Tax=Ostrinia furnacalis TaxID=93504 RepID=UPI00103B2EBC|nr:fatty acid-binding protein-like [Ostrinia furnacalis]XP_028166674.1 fatty acid-binding protein-like [Ostrinia furnacalis]
MSFFGKKFRRIGCENMEALVKQTNPISPQLAYILNAPAPVFSYTQHSPDQYIFRLELDSKVMSHFFRLGEELELEKKDGSKVKVTYTLGAHNVLHKVVQTQDGKKMAHFRQEFGENEAIMYIKLDGSDVEGRVYYEAVT